MLAAVAGAYPFLAIFYAVDIAHPKSQKAAASATGEINPVAICARRISQALT